MRKVVTTYFCDKCGKELHDLIFTLKLSSRVEVEGEWTQESDDTVVIEDLCEDCAEKVMNAIKDAGKEKKRSAGGRPSKKIEIDLGKVSALHRAGWTDAKIAEEFHCSVSTLRNRVREELELKAKSPNKAPDYPNYWDEQEEAV